MKDFLLLALEAVLGVGLACTLLVPSVLTVLQNYRTTEYINGWNAVLYNQVQRYLHILTCFFFPPDLPARPNFTPDSSSKWSSLGAWLPLFGMTGVIGWLQMRRKHWLKKFIWILFLMALVPFLNSAFQMMNSAFYARWYYMLTLMMAMATVLALENDRVNWKRSIKWTTVITVAIAVVIGFMPTSETVDGVKSFTFGLEDYPTRFWSYVAISLVSLGAVVYLFCFCRKNKKVFFRSTLVAVSIISVFYSIFFIALGKTQSEYTWDHLIPYSLNGGKNVDLPDLQESRSDFYESLDNAAMFWEIPSIQAFHSVVPGSIMEFYDSIGVPRDVASRPTTDHYAIRGLLSVHWLFDDDHDDQYFAGEDSSNPAVPGFAYYGNSNGFDIWENLYYIPMGFSYDYYITRSEYDALSEGSENAIGDRELAMLRAVVIEDDRAQYYDGILEHLPEDMRTFNEENYLTDCQDRAARSCSSFQYTNTGFTAELDSDRQQIIFFSVPYESGWSATVNGETVPIEKVNVGFMAVTVPEGEDVVIEFTYHTPGLTLGFIITLVSLAVLVAYLMLMNRVPSRTAPVKTISLLRVGKFSQYTKSRHVSFRRPGALIPHVLRQAVVPEESDSQEESPSSEAPPSAEESSTQEPAPAKEEAPQEEPSSQNSSSQNSPE